MSSTGWEILSVISIYSVFFSGPLFLCHNLWQISYYLFNVILLSTLPIDKKLKARKHSPAFSKGKHSFGKEGQLENHIGKVQIHATKSDDPNKYKSFIPTDMHIAGEDNCVNDTDIPERMQVMISKCLLITNILM